MNDIDLLLELPIKAQIAAICFVICTTGLLVMLLTAPRQNCFFFRWRPEMRLLALLVAPTLLILWPVVLYSWFLRSRGVDPADLGWDD
jgi:hypothetical protein